MLTKGAIGNLVNRYRSVLKKCNLMNTFGSLAVASMLVLGGAGVACAQKITEPVIEKTVENENVMGLHGTQGEVIDASTVEEISVTRSGTKGAAYGVRSDSSAQVTLGSAEKDLSVSVTNSGTDGSNAIGFCGRSEVNERNTKILTYAKNLTITSTSSNYNAYGIYAMSCHSEGYVSGNTELIFDTENTSVIVTGKPEYTSAICSLSGSRINIKGNFYASANDGNGHVIFARAGNIEIGQNNETVQLNGNITLGTSETGGEYDVDSDIKIKLTGAASSWTGNMQVYREVANYSGSLEVTSPVITLVDGATWTPTKSVQSYDSLPSEGSEKELQAVALSNLELEDGNIVIKSGIEAKVKNVTGDGNVLVDTTGEKLGSFTAKAAAAGTAFDVQAADADGNALNADQTDAATLQAVRKQVKSEDGNATVTASAEEGKVNGAISVAADGTVSTARNTLMDAALNMASVTNISLDRILTNDVRKRMGDLRTDNNQNGVWMRWDGGKLKGDGGLTNNFNTIQIGADSKFGFDNARFGIAASFTHGDGDFARGDSDMEGFSFAAYGTWMAENGLFADVVARMGSFETELNVEGDKGDLDSIVSSLSGELGWRFDVCKSFYVEPQVELAYTYVKNDDLQLGSAKYEFDDVDSLIGRAGLAAGWKIGERGDIYARASVVQQFLGDAKISGSNGSAVNVQEIDGDDTWFEYGIGGQVKLTDKTYIWADVERTEGASIDEEWRGTVGFRLSF